MPPHQILPVTLDVGTNNPQLLADPEYRGLRQKRVTGAAYEALVAEFIAALKAWQPHVLLQFEVGAPAVGAWRPRARLAGARPRAKGGRQGRAAAACRRQGAEGRTGLRH